MARRRILTRLGKKRGAQVITLIHRQEVISFLGIPLARYIDIDDSEQVLRAIRGAQKDIPIDIILHTPGGLALAATQIAMALKSHPATKTVLVPHYAMSGGTLIALPGGWLVDLLGVRRVVFGGMLIANFVSQIEYVLPLAMDKIAVVLMLGTPLPAMFVSQLIATAGLSLVFIVVALWRFQHVEL